MAYIHAYSSIRDRILYHEDEIIFSETTGNLESFLNSAFESQQFVYPKFYKMDRLAQLGILASEHFSSKIKLLGLAPDETGIILCNSNASLDADARFSESTKTVASPSLFVYTLPNIVSGEISIRQGIKGENAFFVTPEFNPSLVASYVEQLIQTTAIKACIAGWVDVFDERHDVFLYLAIKEKLPGSVEHSAQHIQNLYNRTNGTVKK